MNFPNQHQMQHNNYRDDPSYEVAMTIIATGNNKRTGEKEDTHTNDGAAIFNPLVDAPPRPPPMSYQNASFCTLAVETPSSSGDMEGAPAHHRRPGSASNYYYSSSQQNMYKSHPYHFASSSPIYQLELQQRQRRRNRCRIALVLFFLLYLSWRNRRSRSTNVGGIGFDDDIVTELSVDEAGGLQRNATVFGRPSNVVSSGNITVMDP